MFCNSRAEESRVSSFLSSGFAFDASFFIVSLNLICVIQTESVSLALHFNTTVPCSPRFKRAHELRTTLQPSPFANFAADAESHAVVIIHC